MREQEVIERSVVVFVRHASIEARIDANRHIASVDTIHGILSGMSSFRANSRDIVLQERDYALLRELYESRIMTRQHIAELFFDGSSEAAKKRVQKLMGIKLIAERARQPSEPAILHLATGGYRLLESEGLLSEYPEQGMKSFQKRVQVGDGTVKHELDVMSIKAGMARSVRGNIHLEIAAFQTWPKLYQFRARRPVVQDGWTATREMAMKPDGFVRLHEHLADGDGVVEHAFFLEVDRGTERHPTITSKVEGYRHYYRSGGFAERCGYDPSNPGACPFRVLLVLRTPERCQRIAESLLAMSPPVKSHVWLAVFDAVVADPFEQVWQTPGDIVVAGTLYRGLLE